MEHNSPKSHNQKSKYWQHHIDQCHQRGMSQRHYCQLNNLALSTFSFWKRKIGKKQEDKIQFYPLVLPGDSGASDHSGLKLHVMEKRFRIELAKDFSPSTLKRLITTLEQL